jgi:hypothetical protein
MRVLARLLCIVTQVWRVNANVEKTIFLGPSAVVLPHDQPSLEGLRLHTLSPSQTILPLQLPVLFPSALRPRGLESWYLLQHLDAERRYEVRICWPATVRKLHNATCLFSSISNASIVSHGAQTIANIFSNRPTSGWIPIQSPRCSTLPGSYPHSHTIASRLKSRSWTRETTAK